MSATVLYCLLGRDLSGSLRRGSQYDQPQPWGVHKRHSMSVNRGIRCWYESKTPPDFTTGFASDSRLTSGAGGVPVSLPSSLTYGPDGLLTYTRCLNERAQA
jgi:hypothetical protein